MVGVWSTGLMAIGAGSEKYAGKLRGREVDAFRELRGENRTFTLFVTAARSCTFGLRRSSSPRGTVRGNRLEAGRAVA